MYKIGATMDDATIKNTMVFECDDWKIPNLL